jgi:DNA-binding PadR family transcriptional regulator
MTTSEIKVLEALKVYPQRSAGKLATITGLSLGSIYPVLARLEISGKIESRFLEGRYPRRRIYWLKTST